MAGLSADRPSEIVLAARVARQSYLHRDRQGRRLRAGGGLTVTAPSPSLIPA